MKRNSPVKHRILAVLMAGLLACTACEMEEKGMGEARVWTVNERAVLESVGVDAERLDNNELRQGERKMLEALAQVEAYLQARYPDEEMRFVDVNNSMVNAKTYSFSVISSAAEEAFVVKLFVNEDEDAEDDIRDSRFSVMKQAELQALVQNVLQEMQIPAVCNMELTGLYGAEYDPSKPLTELLASGLLVNISGRIYAEQSAVPEDIEQQLAAMLRGKGLCSGVRLLVVKDGMLEKAAELPLWENPYVVSDQAVLLPAKAVTEVE